MSKKYRIIILIGTSLLGFSGYYFWYYRTVNICDIPVIARMHNHEFVDKTIAILPMGKTQKADIVDLSILFKELYGIKVEILPFLLKLKNLKDLRRSPNSIVIDYR